MTDFHDALRIVLDHATRTGTEVISLENACGRVLALDVNAPSDLPPFSKSAMDGYACRKEDTENGMEVLEVIAAGSTPVHQIVPGTCSKIMTGALMPLGANAVLTVENATLRQGRVYGRQPSSDNNIRQGEDLKSGELVLKAGMLMQPQHVSLLAMCGITIVTVSREITVGILSTGDELLEPGTPALSGKIYNSNSWQLMAMMRQMGAVPTYYGIAADSVEETRHLLKTALNANQVVILTGGVSEGDYDQVPRVIRELGFEILFDRVRVQPGKPTTFAVSASTGKFIFGLPGNPVSSFVQCRLIIYPFLAAMQGALPEPVTTLLPLKGAYTRRKADRMAHIPIRINPDGTCSALPYNGSAHLAALSAAHGLGRIPVGVQSIRDGEKIQVQLF
ncbi:MAG: molybdopterin molybdotransferase MoeA [Bacteroidales bacterium]|nr:molybdopterin molybdotransferase MoeA [Bacteroidales bacterium]